MTQDTHDLTAYFRQLTADDREQLESRLQRHRDQLAEQGYDASIAEGEHGLFAGVLVIDEEGDRVGFLEADGTINWLSGDVGGIGALGAAIVQRPSDRLQKQTDGPENVDIE